MIGSVKDLFVNISMVSIPMELKKAGERLQQAALLEQAFDQYIEVWKLENSNS